MKKLFLLVSLSILTSVTMAQLIIQAQYNLWMPTSKYNGEVKIGYIGAGVEVKHVFNDILSGTVGVNYALLNKKTVIVNRVESDNKTLTDNAALQIIPITVGLDAHFLTGKWSPYLDMDFGVALVDELGDNIPKKNMVVNPYLSPGIGIEYELTDDIKLNASLKSQVLIYNFDGRNDYLETFTAIGINLGFNYKF